MNNEARKLLLENIMEETHTLAPSINIIEYGSVIGYNKRIENIIVKPTGVAYQKLIMKN